MTAPGGIHVIPDRPSSHARAEHVAQLIDALPPKDRVGLHGRNLHVIIFDPASTAGVCYLDEVGRALVVLAREATDDQVRHELGHALLGHKPLDPQHYAACQAEADVVARTWAAIAERGGVDQARVPHLHAAEAARRPVDLTKAPKGWTPGDVFWLASGLGFPEVQYAGRLLNDAATWRAALDAADPATLEALRAVLAEEPVDGDAD